MYYRFLSARRRPIAQQQPKKKTKDAAAAFSVAARRGGPDEYQRTDDGSYGEVDEARVVSMLARPEQKSASWSLRRALLNAAGQTWVTLSLR